MKLFSSDLACQQAIELVTDYLEGRMSRRDRRRFEKHVASCPNCHTYFEQIRATIAIMGEIPAETLEPEARQDLIDLFRRFHDGEP